MTRNWCTVQLTVNRKIFNYFLNGHVCTVMQRSYGIPVKDGFYLRSSKLIVKKLCTVRRTANHHFSPKKGKRTSSQSHRNSLIMPSVSFGVLFLGSQFQHGCSLTCALISCLSAPDHTSATVFAGVSHHLRFIQPYYCTHSQVQCYHRVQLYTLCMYTYHHHHHLQGKVG